MALIGCLVLLSGCINLTQKIIDPDWNKAGFPRCGNTDCTRLVSGNDADARLASVFAGMVGDAALSAPVLAGGVAPALITFGALYITDVTIWLVRMRNARRRWSP